MYEVTEVPFGINCKTRIWFSKRAEKETARFCRKGDPNGAFMKKLRHHLQNGLWNAEAGNSPPVRPEWNGIYRIGFDGSLFRLIGFYEDNSKRDFIVIDAYLKRGQKLDASQRDRIENAVTVRQQKLWKKVVDERYPRLAE